MMMVFGTGTMVASKYMLSVCAGDFCYYNPSDDDCSGITGKKETFSKALYQSFIMFLAMACALIVEVIVHSIVYAIYPDRRPQPEDLTPEEKKAKKIQSAKVSF